MLYDIEIEGYGTPLFDGDEDRYAHFTVNAHATRRERNGAHTLPTALALYGLHRALADGVDSGTMTVSIYEPVRILKDGDYIGACSRTLETWHWNTHAELRRLVDVWSRKPQNGRTVYYRPTERY